MTILYHVLARSQGVPSCQVLVDKTTYVVAGIAPSLLWPVVCEDYCHLQHKRSISVLGIERFERDSQGIQHRLQMDTSLQSERGSHRTLL